MQPLRIHTDRLELVAGSVEHCHAEIAGPDRLAKLLGVEIPPTWPPPFNDIASMQWAAQLHEANPGAAGWVNWYFVATDNTDGTRTVIGGGGFKGPPTPEGSVEIGYSLLEAYHGKGYASEAVRGLIGWALGHPEVRRVVAETFPDLTASIRLLERVGFRLTGPGSEEGTILFDLPRETFDTLA